MFILTQKKRCSTCGEWKDKSGFGKNKSNKDGLRFGCKSCRREYDLANIDKKHASAKKSRENNREKYLSGVRAWKAKNIEYVKEKAREYKKRKLIEDREKVLEINRKAGKKWRTNNLEENRRRGREAYYAQDMDKRREMDRKRYWENLDLSRAKAKIRNYKRRHALGAGWTLEEENKLLADYGYRCAYCNKKKPLTLDHVVAITGGGENSIKNIVPSCKSCNSSKRDKPLLFWMLQRLFRKDVT